MTGDPGGEGSGVGTPTRPSATIQILRRRHRSSLRLADKASKANTPAIKSETRTTPPREGRESYLRGRGLNCSSRHEQSTPPKNEAPHARSSSELEKTDHLSDHSFVGKAGDEGCKAPQKQCPNSTSKISHKENQNTPPRKGSYPLRGGAHGVQAQKTRLMRGQSLDAKGRCPNDEEFIQEQGPRATKKLTRGARRRTHTEKTKAHHVRSQSMGAIDAHAAGDEGSRGRRVLLELPKHFRSLHPNASGALATQTSASPERCDDASTDISALSSPSGSKPPAAGGMPLGAESFSKSAPDESEQRAEANKPLSTLYWPSGKRGKSWDSKNGSGKDTKLYRSSRGEGRGKRKTSLAEEGTSYDKNASAKDRPNRGTKASKVNIPITKADLYNSKRIGTAKISEDIKRKTFLPEFCSRNDTSGTYNQIARSNELDRIKRLSVGGLKSEISAASGLDDSLAAANATHRDFTLHSLSNALQTFRRGPLSNELERVKWLSTGMPTPKNDSAGDPMIDSRRSELAANASHENRRSKMLSTSTKDPSSHLKKSNSNDSTSNMSIRRKAYLESLGKKKMCLHSDDESASSISHSISFDSQASESSSTASQDRQPPINDIMRQSNLLGNVCTVANDDDNFPRNSGDKIAKMPEELDKDKACESKGWGSYFKTRRSIERGDRFSRSASPGRMDNTGGGSKQVANMGSRFARSVSTGRMTCRINGEQGRVGYHKNSNGTKTAFATREERESVVEKWGDGSNEVVSTGSRFACSVSTGHMGKMTDNSDRSKIVSKEKTPTRACTAYQECITAGTGGVDDKGEKAVNAARPPSNSNPNLTRRRYLSSPSSSLSLRRDVGVGSGTRNRLGCRVEGKGLADRSPATRFICKDAAAIESGNATTDDRTESSPMTSVAKKALFRPRPLSRPRPASRSISVSGCNEIDVLSPTSQDKVAPSSSTASSRKSTQQIGSEDSPLLDPSPAFEAGKQGKKETSPDCDNAASYAVAVFSRVRHRRSRSLSGSIRRSCSNPLLLGSMSRSIKGNETLTASAAKKDMKRTADTNTAKFSLVTPPNVTNTTVRFRNLPRKASNMESLTNSMPSRRITVLTSNSSHKSRKKKSLSPSPGPKSNVKDREALICRSSVNFDILRPSRLVSFSVSVLCKATVPIQCLVRQYLAKNAVVERKKSIVAVQSLIRRWTWMRHLKSVRVIAFRCQGAYRGMVARDNLDFQHYCAVRIQAVWRSCSGILAFANAMKRIILVQRIWRMKLHQRRHIAAMKSCMKLREARAALVIQTYFRRHMAMDDLLYQISDILICQATARRFFALKQASMLRHTRDSKAALLIQTNYRTHRAKVNFEQEVLGIILCQVAVRRFLALKRTVQMREAACVIKIQATWRRRLACNRILLENNAATAIQSRFRGWGFLLSYEVTKIYVVRIQACTRSHFAKCRLKRLKTEMVQEKQTKEKKAATVIQSCFRGYWGFLRYLVAKFSVVQIQGCMRSHLAKCVLRRLKQEKIELELFPLKKSAAIIIQSYFRGYRDYVNFTIVQFSIIKMQTCFRCYQGRRHLKQLKRENREKTIRKNKRLSDKLSRISSARMNRKQPSANMNGKQSSAAEETPLYFSPIKQNHVVYIAGQEQVKPQLSSARAETNQPPASGGNPFPPLYFSTSKENNVATRQQLQDLLKSRVSQNNSCFGKGWQERREKKAALVIERFFIRVRAEIELEIARLEQKEQKKLAHAKRKIKKDRRGRMGNLPSRKWELYGREQTRF